MHGIFLTEFKKYIKATRGDEAWDAVRARAGLQSRAYVPIQHYPDKEAAALVAAASAIDGAAATQILESYGRFIVTDLLSLYRGLLQPEWRSLELIEHAQEMIDRVKRLNGLAVGPPELSVERASEERVVVRYESPRKLCVVGKGMLRGIGDHFGDELEVTEDACMLSGHAFCRVGVSLAVAAAAA
jgi:predicted hydrocarbon binding protein